MTAAELWKQRSAGEGPNQTPGCPGSWLETEHSPQPQTLGIKSRNPQGKSRFQHDHFRLEINLVVHGSNPSTVGVETSPGYISLPPHSHSVPGLPHSIQQIQPR